MIRRSGNFFNIYLFPSLAPPSRLTPHGVYLFNAKDPIGCCEDSPCRCLNLFPNSLSSVSWVLLLDCWRGLPARCHEYHSQSSHITRGSQNEGGKGPLKGKTIFQGPPQNCNSYQAYCMFTPICPEGFPVAQQLDHAADIAKIMCSFTGRHMLRNTCLV